MHTRRDTWTLAHRPPTLPMPPADDAAADRVYERMIARLEGDDKRECVQTMGPADTALSEVVERNESELKECEEVRALHRRERAMRPIDPRPPAPHCPKADARRHVSH